MNKETREWLYKSLSDKGYNLGTYEDFDRHADDEDTRKWLYDAGVKSGLELGSYNDFSKGMTSSNGEGTVARQVINEYDASAAKENSSRTSGDASRQVGEETKQQIIANKPDYFKRDTRSLLDKGAGVRAGIAQSPSAQVGWQEQFDRLNADINQRVGYVYGQNGTYIAKKNTSNQLDSILSDVDTMEKGLREKAEGRRGAHNGYAYATPEEAKENNLLRSARSLLEDAKSIVEEAGKKGRTNAISGLFRGMRDNLSIDDITFGIADAVNEGNLNKALQKYDRGEQLTEAEEKLLEASAVNLAVQNYFGSDLGAGYKAGQVTAASLPFMLEFAVNPIARSGNAIAKGLLKFGMNRFGRAGSFASRVAGSTGAALGMTATTGLPQVAANTMERLNENYEYYLDGNGDLQFEKAGNTNSGEAFGKSIASTALTNQSEMVLNAFRVFRPYLRRMNELMPGSVNTFIKSVKNSRPGQLYREIKNNPTIRELARRTQFQGFPQEYLEEVYNNLASVPLGDMTMEDVVDLQNNIDIALGLAPTMLAFSMIGTGGMAAERYQNRRRMERIFGKMSSEQRKKFEELQRLSRQNGNEDIKAFIRETVTDPTLTQEQKREEIEYAFALATDNAINEVQEAETEDRIERETRDILANSDQETGTYTECVRYVTNDVGERVEVPGYIVGHMGGRPLWKPEGADDTVEAIPLKDGEYDPASIKSMPVQEVIDETAQAIREDAEEQARREEEAVQRESIGEPVGGETFTVGGITYEAEQNDPDYGWMFNLYDAGGNLVGHKPIPVEEYRQLRLQEQQEQQAATQPIVEQPVQPEAGVQPTEAQSAPQPSPLEALTATLPKKNDGTVDYKNLTPRQQYDYTSLTESPEVAAQDLQADVEAAREEIGKMQERLAKATGGARAELRDQIRSRQAELSELEEFYNSVAPQPQANETQAEVEEAPEVQSVPEEIVNDDEYLQWVADNSDDADEITGAYNMAKEAASHEVTLEPWQRELLGRKISTDSFNRFGDRNHVGRTLAMGWLRKDGEQLDTLAQELSELGGVEVTEQNIIDFMMQHPSGHVSQSSETMRSLSRRFSEVATKEMGFPIGGPESNTGRLYIQLKQANQRVSELTDTQKQEMAAAVQADTETANDVQEQQWEEPLTENYARIYDEALTQMNADEADRLVASRLEEEQLYDSMTAEELDEIYATINQKNDGTSRQEEDSLDGTEYPLQEGIDEGEEPAYEADLREFDSTQRGEDSAVEEAGIIENEAIPANEPLHASGGTEEVTQPTGFIAPERESGEDVLDYAGRVAKVKEIDDARKEVSANPTDAQKEAGNYKKGHIKLDGYDISVENPKGSTRSGVDADGQPWIVTMNNDYGYIRGTEGVDGDHIDVFLSDDPTTGDVYVIDQVKEDGTFDEHKVMYGFKSEDEARNAYLSNYSPDWKGLGSITKVSKEEFKKWVDSSHRKTKPFAEYKKVRSEQEESGNGSSDNLQPIATGDFGPIYDQFVGKPQEAIDFLLSKRNGEAVGALHHRDVGAIDLVWGKEGTSKSDGYGLSKLVKFHPEVLENLQEILDDTQVVKRTENRVQLESEKYKAAVRLTWDGQRKNWLLTAFQKETPTAADRTTDIGGTELQNDTAPLQTVSASSENKDSDSSSNDQGKDGINSYGANNKLVSRDRYEELKAKMRQKLGGQMNMGIDPEIFAIGVEMTAYHIEAGARKFADYARVMIADLGDAIRPYLKTLYNGAKTFPGVYESGLTKEMTPEDEVFKFDVANFDKPVVNVLDMADTIAKEQEVKEQAETAKEILTEQEEAKEDGLRPATEEDIEKNPVVFYKGKGYKIMTVVRKGEQTGPASFSEPHITSVYLHNGQEVKLEDLSVRDEKPAEEEERPEETKEAPKEKKPKEQKKRTKKSVTLPLNDLFTQTEESNEQGSTEPDSSVGSRARQETERTEQRGTGRSVHGDNVPDSDGSGRVPESAGTSSSRQPVVRNQRNYRFGEDGIPVPQGDIAKLKANVAAIRTLKEIEASGQPATEEQKEILSRYVGWGGLADALNEDKYNARNSYYKQDANWNSKYLPYYERLRELLSDEEFQSAVQSTTTSHYTPTPVIRALWNIVEQSGFKGGVVSEPAMGIGHIIGLMPAEISGQSRIGGYEIDSLSGRIASQLYPDADVKVQGYETNFVPQSKDLVITNVPFGRNAPYDKNLDRSLKRELGNAYNLHNYFIAKSLLELKEGGLGVFVTSSATMDGADSHFREFVAANNIDLVGAIRLPNNAFLQNAGTSVTADILVFRKRKSGEPSNGTGFVSTTQIGEGTYEENGEKRTKPILVNEYFAERPDMMLGEMMTAFDAGSGGLYSGSSQTLKPKAGANLVEELDKAVGKLPKDILSNENTVARLQEREETSLKNGTITTKNGKVYVAVNGELVSVDVKDTFTFNGKERKTVDAVNDYNSLKDTLRKLIAAEQSEEKDPKALRNQLNEQYDAFVDKYGTLNRNKALDDVFVEDYEHNLPLSLEEVSRVPSPTGKSMVWQVKKGKGILDRRVSYPINEPTTAENLQDALNISLSYKGTLDIPYMARLMNETEEQVTDEIVEQGVAYRDPITGALVDRDTYLSGNVREKLEEARTAAESNPDYQKNVEDLMAVQPETIRFGDISYRLGTPWIPTEYINDFAENVLGISGVDVHYEPLLNEFVVSRRAHVSDFAKSGLYKTERMGSIDLFTNALNQRKPKIYDEQTTYGPTGKSTIRVPNEAETQAASEKVMEISDKFIEYIDGRNEIHRELERIYNDKYNNYRLKKYSLPSFSHKEKDKDGKEVLVTHYPGSNEAISLREHQAKAVQRSLHESTLLAHQVGTGKTFTMITTAMEMRRLGLARKPMIVVQNATLEDFVKDFYRLYPSANVLAPSKDERSAENRKRLFNLIATGDFDAIVIPQSFLAFIPDDEGRKAELVQKRIDEYQEAIARTDDYALQRRLKKEMEAMRDSLEGGDGKKSKKSNVKNKAKAAERAKSRAERVLDRKTDDVMSFEKLGIDALFIDEAHNFKKIGFATKMNNVKGVDSGASQRANSLLLKARWVQEKNGGRNVILATGTPITNTMAEVWTMMNFVSPDILNAYNIQSFDDFATTFGMVEPSLEFTATGNFKIADRFKSYVNVPELLKAFRSHADVVLTEDVKEFQQDKNIPKLADGKMENIVIDKNEDLQDVMDMLVRELEDYNKLSGQAKREKSALPLVVFTKAKQAAIDLRLLNPNYADNPNSKTNQVVRNIVKLYKESTPDKGTQLVFCDSYQSPGERPKMDLFDYDPDVPRFNLYEDMKEKLVAAGIPANEIAIVNNYDGERRKGLFEKVRNGDVRILLGSTEKMGVGVNVQDRLFALHHVDAPLRPMDFEQRNGRILRQGNLYATWDKPVHVLTYGVQGTLDATAYDRLRVKQEFINQMMKGNTDSRVMEEQDDEDPSGMTFSQMAATLSGDKTAQLLFAAQNKLKRLRNSKRSDANSKSAMADSIEAAKSRIKQLQAARTVYEKASKVADDHFPDGVKKVKVDGKTFTEKFGVNLDPVIDTYDESYSLNRGIAPLKLNLNDGAAEVVVHYNEGRMVYELYAGKEHIVESRQFNGGRGLMSSIDHQLDAIKKNLSETEANILAQEKKIEGLTQAMNAPWGREEELNEAEKEVADLQKQLEEKAKDNEKKKKDDVMYRNGSGLLSDSALSAANDPASKLLGKSARTARQRREFAERERGRMVKRIRELTEKLHLDNVDIVTDTSTLQGKRAKAKGFFNPRTGRITIVLPNHTSVFDAEQSLLHEAVAHYGLRQLFGEHFDTFLDNVYAHADEDVRRRIADLAINKYGYNFRKATEEYLASLAERTDFENANASWWNKIKDLFLQMLHKIGFEDFSGVTLSDNELRYILWRSYENLRAPGSRDSILGEAVDIAKQYELQVGNYAPAGADVGRVADAADSVKAERIRKLRESKPVEITGEEYKGKYELNRDSAKQWIKNNLRKKYPIDDTGETVSIGRKGVNKVTSHSMGNEAHLKSLVAIPRMLKSAVFITEEKAGKPKAQYPKYRYYVVGLKIGDVDYTAKITVGVDENGNKFYDHSLTDIEKGNLIEIANGFISTGAEPNPSVTDIKDTKLLSILQENEEENNENENDVLFRDGEPEVHERVYARKRYEERIKSGMYQMQEALQDSMLGLREAMDAILRGEGKKNVNIEDVAGFENAYLGENRLSSINKAEADAFANLLFKPLLDELAKLAPNDDARTALTDYMMAKHGLERNRVMAERDAKRDYEATQQAHPHSKKTLQDFIDEYRKKDYAGLTTLTGKGNVADAEAEAQMMVDDYEATHNTTALWKRTKDASNAILSKLHETGMMSKETYDNVRSMYEYYIPLRGFDEKTSQEAYAYLNSKNSAFNAPIKTAKGRKSKADDPFAYLQSMAENAIMQGNRNKLVKQRFLNFVLNHPSDLASVSDLWVKYDDVTDEWKPVFPDNINKDDTAEEVARKMQEFDERMKLLAKQDPKLYKHGSDAAKVPYRVVTSSDLHQHQVVVKKGGRDYVITINGSPRAAQAINGLTNPDNDISGKLGDLLNKTAGRLNRELSALYTTRNPDFILSNTLRDMLYANSMVWIKENPAYALRFNRNFAKVNHARMVALFDKLRKGTLDMNDPMENMFHQFVMNGGETGYSNIRDIEQHKNDIRRELKKANGKLPIRKAMSLLGERLDEVNRGVENCARFAAFVTSREMGRTIDRSIYDAKEISVNFNKKGAGAKFIGENGQTWLGNVAGGVSGYGRFAYVFWNAAIQGTTNFGRQVKRHPAKAFTSMALMFVLGALVASLGADDDDDKNAYYNLPEYVRRSNLMFKIAGQWISIPLPVEYRAVYGLGELMAGTISGKEHLTDAELADQVMAQISQVLPLDLLNSGAFSMEGKSAKERRNSVLLSLAPSAIKPFAEVIANKDWTGLPIYKDTPWNENMPEWTKAYKSTNRQLVALSRALNEATGGDKYTKGAIDINPAVVEHLLEGYFGGIASTIDKMVKTAETIAGQREYDPRSFIWLNRVVKNGDERTESRAINKEYFRLKEEHDEIRRRVSSYERDTSKGIFDYAEKINFLYNSPEYRRYEIFENYRPAIDDLYDFLKEANANGDQEAVNYYEAELNEVKREMIKEVNKTRE